MSFYVDSKGDLVGLHVRKFVDLPLDVDLTSPKIIHNGFICTASGNISIIGIDNTTSRTIAVEKGHYYPGIYKEILSAGKTAGIQGYAS